MTDVFRLDGEVVLVTGATAGIGRRIAVLLADQGASVAVVGRREGSLVNLAEEINARGSRALTVPLDVSDIDAIPASLDRIEENLGPVGILVNNAGLSRRKRIVTAQPSDFDEMMNVNLRGPYFMAAEVAKRLIERGASGNILNVSSSSGLRPMVGYSIYSISKAAIIHMTRAMALEWAPHLINVNAICPGYILSEMTAELASSETGAKLREGLPRKRIGVPEDLDCMVLALVSPANRFTTGAIIAVDDGIAVS